MNRRDVLSALGVTLAGVAVNAGWAAGTQPAERPNIIFMMTDDQGYSDLSCYGSPDIKTPNLDRMAAEGVRFTDYYAAGSVCTPTRASLMTGRLISASLRNVTQPRPLSLSRRLRTSRSFCACRTARRTPPLYASKEFRKKSAAGLRGDMIEEADWSVGQVLQ